MITFRILLSSLIATLVVGCGGGGIDSSVPAPGASTPPPTAGVDCGQTRLKQSVLETARDWYLFPELLPTSIDPALYANVDDFLDALTATARAQSKDRFFSYTTSIATENALLQGSSAGFGVSFLARSNPNSLFIGQVFEGSAAADAGLARGDEILAIGTSVATLQTIAQIAASSGGLSAALGPSTVGESRTFRWRNLAGVVTDRSITKRNFEINPVPASSVRVLTTASGTRVGFFTLRSFVSDPGQSGQPVELAALRNAFSLFAAQNVQNVIIDLRYNGGGLVSIAELMLNLLAGDQVGQVSYANRLNTRQSAQNDTRRFTRQPQTLPTRRVAFLVTQQSASASELVINSSVPYIKTAVIGTRSFGKPVGQFAFDVSACDFRLRLIAFKTVNRNDDGDYFTGFPYPAFTNAGGVACAASDDLTRAPGDPAEGLTASALAWIGSANATCPAAAIALEPDKAAALAPAEKSLDLLDSRPRDALQAYLPGTY